jgi:hypothetical protein
METPMPNETTDRQSNVPAVVPKAEGKATGKRSATSKNSKPDSEKSAREQSSIQFPYADLNDAITVAQALMQGGGQPCEADALAALMDQTPSSGNFRLKVTTARMFGLVELAQGKYQLTELGFRIIDSNSATERGAKADAFLNVPLYKRVYEEFRGKQLPPRPAALEHAFVGFGVSHKQKDKARQAFDRSAQQAGYFELGGRDRLVRPNVAGGPQNSESGGTTKRVESDHTFSLGGGGGGGSRLHPFIAGLLSTLPKPESEWPGAERVKWLQTAASIFGLIYMDEGGEIKVTFAPSNSTRRRGLPADDDAPAT